MRDNWRNRRKPLTPFTKRNDVVLLDQADHYFHPKAKMVLTEATFQLAQRGQSSLGELPKKGWYQIPLSISEVVVSGVLTRHGTYA